MIPFAIFACEFQGAAEPIEVRALEMTQDFFTIRLDCDVDSNSFLKAELHFFQFEKGDYLNLELNEGEFRISNIKTEIFFHEYKVEIENDQYRQAAVELLKEYGRYISLKLGEDESIVSQKLTGYPAELEQNISDSFALQKKVWIDTAFESAYRWGSEEKDLSAVKKIIKKGYDDSIKNIQEFEDKNKQMFGISMDRPDLWVQYMGAGCAIMMKNYFQSYFSDANFVMSQAIRYLYIGNPYCSLLFPDEDILEALLCKVIEDEYIPVMVFSFVRDHELERLHRRMEIIEKWFADHQEWIFEKTGMRKLEVVVNDWGTFEVVCAYSKRVPLSITLGTLLAKRRKDTRWKWKKGMHNEKGAGNPNPFYKSTLDDELFLAELKKKAADLHIAYESCEYDLKISDQQAALFFPFYQMNTSSYCTLQAYCKNHARGCQSSRDLDHCPEYCREYAFLYPDFLRMTGRYNSLFGFDPGFLTEQAWLERKKEQGVSRFIWNLL